MSWWERAACKGLPESVFFAERGGRNMVKKAREVCKGCPVKAECLADAEESERGACFSERHGIRGGLTPRERADLARAS